MYHALMRSVLEFVVLERLSVFEGSVMHGSSEQDPGSCGGNVVSSDLAHPFLVGAV